MRSLSNTSLLQILRIYNFFIFPVALWKMTILELFVRFAKEETTSHTNAKNATVLFILFSRSKPILTQFCDEHYWNKQTHTCLVIIQKTDNRKIINSKQEQQYFCGHCKTKLYTVNHYYCQDCKTLYCLKHRHKENHICQQKSSDSCQLI